MATDVPVQLDGVSEAERPAPEGATAPHNAHQQGKHSKRSRDGKEKDRHKHSKHRKRSKPEHRSSERRERHDDGGRSPAVESGEIEAPDAGAEHTSHTPVEKPSSRGSSKPRSERAEPRRDTSAERRHAGSSRRGGEGDARATHSGRSRGDSHRPGDIASDRRSSDAPARRGNDAAGYSHDTARRDAGRRGDLERRAASDTRAGRPGDRNARGAAPSRDMRDVRRGEPQTVREWPDRRGPGRGHDHERDRYQRGGRSDYDGRRDEGRVHSRTHARERDEAPPGDELLEKYEALLTAEEREAQEIEERRKRRAALAAKFAAQSPAPSKPSATPERSRSRSPARGGQASLPPRTVSADPVAAARSEPGSTAGLPEDVDAVVVAAEGGRVDSLFRSSGDQGDAKGSPRAATALTAAASDSEDGGIFAVDDDDDAPAAGGAQDVVPELEAGDDRLRVKQAAQASKTNAGLSDMYDDSQGYYNFRVGEVMAGRYEVVKASGKGVFSSVVTALDKLRQDTDGSNPLVAIKLIRANETMYKAGQQELAILRKLADADPDNRKHVIRLLRSFEYRNHLCMVFEHMEMNLRELTRKVGVGRGIKIDAVAQLTLQLLIALRHLQATRVLHADIKPDNVLINARMNKIKLCDMGSALFSGGANDLTPYLVSRFYRAPEVILGLPYDYPMDMWSVACTVFEMFTAEILFKGRDNNDMLRQIMALKGPFPKRMVKKGLFSNLNFADDSSLSFISKEKDVVSGEPVRRLVAAPAKRRSVLQLLTRVAAKEHPEGIPRDELRKVEALAAFLERATALDPGARLTVAEAMQMKFIVTAKQQIAAQQQAAQRKAGQA